MNLCTRNSRSRHNSPWFSIAALVCSLLLFLGAAKTGDERIADSLGFLTLVILILGLKAGTLALSVLISAFHEEKVNSVKSIVKQAPGKSFIVGFLTFWVLAAVLLILIKSVQTSYQPLPKLVVLLIMIFVLLIVIIALAIGLTAIYGYAGTIIRSNQDDAVVSHWRNVLAGGVCLEFATLIPILGQLLRVWLVLTALGGAILAWHARRGMRREYHNKDDQEDSLPLPPTENNASAAKPIDESKRLD